MATRTTSLIPTGTWTVDAAHSSVEFGIKHMGIATVRGKFTEFDGTFGVGEDLASSSAHGSVKVASITTDEEERDGHLRSPDFFNVEEYPEITFESTRVEAVDDESSNILRNLTMHGITREVKINAVVQGTDVDPRGNERVGLEVIGVLIAQRLRHEAQSGARQRQHARRRQRQRVARHLRRQATLKGTAQHPSVAATWVGTERGVSVRMCRVDVAPIDAAHRMSVATFLRLGAAPAHRAATFHR